MDVYLMFFICISSLHTIFTKVIVEVEPRETMLLEGETLTMMCRTKEPIYWCQWRFETNMLDNFEVRTKVFLPNGAEYHGKGIEKGECGMTIPNVTEKNNGVFYCNLMHVEHPINKEDGSLENVTVVIAKVPQAPEINVVRINPFKRNTKLFYKYQNNTFEEYQRIEVECTIKFVRPAPNISWFLGTEPITNKLDSPKITDLGKEHDQKKITQTLWRTLTYSDNGKDLRCVATHFALGSGILTHRIYKLNVYVMPNVTNIAKCAFTIGKPGRVVVTIRSNPKPDIEWFIDGRKMLEGTVTERYHAAKLIDNGNEIWEVVLEINQVRPEDVAKNYTLTARNIIGKISFKDSFCSFPKVS